MAAIKEIGLLGACIEFFGLKPGQSKMDFMRDEFKNLTDADRTEIAAGLEKNGYKIVAPKGI